MKKFISMMLVLLLCFSLCACNTSQKVAETQAQDEAIAEAEKGVNEAAREVSNSLNDLSDLINQYKDSKN